MPFELMKPCKTKIHHAKLNIRNNLDGVLSISSLGIEQLKELGIEIRADDEITLYCDNNTNALAVSLKGSINSHKIKKGNTKKSYNVYSRCFAKHGIKPCVFEIEKSIDDKYDFIMKPMIQ